MSQYSIAVIVGSLRRDSINRKLADALVKLGPADFSFKQVEIGDLPLYNQDDDGNQAPSVIRLKSEIKASSGLSEEEIRKMVREAEAHADEDHRRREAVEERNRLDGLVYSTEKSLKEFGEKIDAATRSSIESALDKAKSALKGEPKAEEKKQDVDWSKIEY